MGIPIPFGQFVPLDSPVHRLEPRVKLGLVACYTVILFSSSGWSGLGLATALAVLALALSRVPMRLALRGLRPVALLLLITVTMNALRWNPTDAIVGFGSLALSRAGLMRGLFFATRIVLLVTGTSLLTLTTSPVALTDALSRLMMPLRPLRFPVDDVAMMFSIALRFIPTTAEEAEKIVVAQAARGARFDEGGVLKRARAWVPVLVPLFVNLFRRADNLAIAMESRCYTGQRRTRLHASRMRASDWAVLLAGVTVAVYATIVL
jgi:energy-coupling factor transport system permease protein